MCWTKNSTVTEGDCEVNFRSSSQQPPVIMWSTVGSSRVSNPSRKIVHLRAVPLGHAADSNSVLRSVIRNFQITKLTWFQLPLYVSMFSNWVADSKTVIAGCPLSRTKFWFVIPPVLFMNVGMTSLIFWLLILLEKLRVSLVFVSFLKSTFGSWRTVFWQNCCDFTEDVVGVLISSHTKQLS